ncbi:MAG: hypothetical protein J5379_09615 [Clostridiales bacterium]|nr:hypothetical protein [Clostridiales bacterium]
MALFDPKKNQISTLQRSIEDKNRQISVCYDEIGKLYYKQYRDMNADVSRDINSRCENISKLYLEIEECRLRILYEKGYKECKNCKKENLLEHAYCSACGAKFPESNDVSVVTHVDPAEMGVVVPVVEKVPAENVERVMEGGDPVTEGSSEAIPQETVVDETATAETVVDEVEEAVEEAVKTEEDS